MDGRSILPLVLNRHRAVLDKWPDTFLIESSGRRETPEQIQEQKQRAAAARYSARFNLVNGNGSHPKLVPEVLVESRQAFGEGTSSSVTAGGHERKELDFSSHEHDDDDDEHDVDADDEDDHLGAVESETEAIELKHNEHPEDYVIDHQEAHTFDQAPPQHDNQHSDNHLTPYRTKMDRLNTECSNPALQQNCVPGQKWQCTSEDGRWRKHKCKFHGQLQQHLAEIHKKTNSYTNGRNCACFTQDNFFYTKIKTKRDHTKWQPMGTVQPMATHQHRRRRTRQKRAVDPAEGDEVLLMEAEGPMMESLIQIAARIDTLERSLHESDLVEEEDEQRQARGRSKRDTASSSPPHLAEVVHELQQMLAEIGHEYDQMSKIGQDDLHNDTTSEDVEPYGGVVAKRCSVIAADKINCSSVVNEDELSWRRNRMKVDRLIRILKDKINVLKDVKRSLREHRPPGYRGEDSEDTDENEDDESIDSRVVVDDYSTVSTSSNSTTTTSTTPIVTESTDASSTTVSSNALPRRVPSGGIVRRPTGKYHNGYGHRRKVSKPTTPTPEQDAEGTLIDMSLFPTDVLPSPSSAPTFNRSVGGRHRGVGGQHRGHRGRHRGEFGGPYSVPTSAVNSAESSTPSSDTRTVPSTEANEVSPIVRADGSSTTETSREMAGSSTIESASNRSSTSDEQISPNSIDATVVFASTTTEQAPVSFGANT
uniref:DUF3740 domain-containing protein n=1 Tax=Anopheles maculatus TaxID=74869 RepID=A0A182T9U9_9DIPT